jgi:hypothetical protein
MTFIIDGTAGATFPNSTTQASAGVVLQVVQATTSTLVSTTNAGFTDTTLTATITPKFSTSKILVLITQPSQVVISSTSAYGGIQILRGSTVIWTPQADSNGPYLFGSAATGVTTMSVYSAINVTYLDSPATTSATTYKTQQKGYGTSVTMQTQLNGASANAVSTITLMEIAG